MFSTPPLFAVLDINQTLWETGYHIVVNTNTPCHLWMRYTLVEPEEHMIARFMRGIALKDDKRFCFVAYHNNEQEEEGDTLRHTFLKPDWPICETRWYYFHGTIDGVASPSTSPIFKLHKLQDAPAEVNFHEYQGVYFRHVAVYRQYWWAETFISPADYLLTRIDLKLMRGGPFDKPVVMGMRATVDNHPTTTDLTTQAIPLASITGDEGGEWKTFQLSIPIKLYANILYAKTLRCPDSPVTTALIWGRDTTGSPPSGLSWASNDSGFTWYAPGAWFNHKCIGIPR